VKLGGRGVELRGPDRDNAGADDDADQEPAQEDVLVYQ
jgi:hypothetical protein